MIGLPSNLRALNAKELHQALAIAIRMERRGEANRVVKEHQRRGIRLDTRTKAWVRDTFRNLI